MGGSRKDRKDRDWSRGRNIGSPLASDSDQGTREVEKEEGKERVEVREETLFPTSAEEIARISSNAHEITRRALDRSGSPIDGPRVRSVSSLPEMHKVRLVSGERKRRKIETDPMTEGEADEEEEEEEEFDRDPRGRKAKDPANAGQFTGHKIRERAKKREEEKAIRLAKQIADPRVKAKSARAESADRNALKMLDQLREAPTPELTDVGFREVEVIKKVASSSKNLNGVFVGQLWKADERLLALNMIFSERIGSLQLGEGRDKAKEVEHLRAEVASGRTENAIFRGQVRELREQVAKGGVLVSTPKQTSAPRRTSPIAKRKKKGGRAVKILSDSSMNTGEENMLERALSPTSRAAGIEARRDVQRDIEDGILPPAIRLRLQGKSVALDGGGELRPLPPGPPRVLRPRRGTWPKWDWLTGRGGRAYSGGLTWPARAGLFRPEKGTPRYGCARAGKGTADRGEYLARGSNPTNVGAQDGNRAGKGGSR